MPDATYDVTIMGADPPGTPQPFSASATPFVRLPDGIMQRADSSSSVSCSSPCPLDRRRRTRTIVFAFLSIALLGITSCETIKHRFLEPAPDWQARTGQLQYRGPKTSLIGEVLVRYSRQGDFELTFSKGPGITLITVRQNDKFVRVSGPLARGSWSGLPDEAPVRLRGWVSLRELLLRSKTQSFVRQTLGPDTFNFAF